MDIMERINALKECGICDECAYNDLIKIIDICKQDDIILTEENAGIMITHISAAFKRNVTNETIEPLAKFIIDDMLQDEKYEQALGIYKKIVPAIENKFNEIEEQFTLLHLCTVLNEI